MTTSAASDLLLPGYRVDDETGAWLTLPWPDDPDEKADLIGSSLGPALIRWAEGWALDRDGDIVEADAPGLTHYLTGQPWRFTPGQKRFMILWYAVDRSGRFLYRSAVKRGAKGTGKDPFGGALADCELCGPVELDDWDDRAGTPIGRPRGLPLVQVMSNSEAQSKDFLRVANALWGRDARDFYGLDCGDTRTIVRTTGGRLEVSTASEASSEGDPATAGFLNETHHMTETSGGQNLAAVMRRNVAKSPRSIQARIVELTNAHQEGAESVAEQSFRAWQAQQAATYTGRRDILYDSTEAPPDTDIMTEAGRLAGLRASYSDAPWADLERLSGEMTDPRTSVADTIRYYLNGLATAEDAWIEPGNFDALAEPRPVLDGAPVAMFLDCSKSEDATALMGVELPTGPAGTLYAFQLGVWQRPRGHRGKDWLAPRDEVDAAVADAFDKYRIQWFGVDPSPAKDDETEALYWAQLVDRWHRDYRARLPLWATPGAQGSAVLFDMRLSAAGGVRRNFAFTKAAELVRGWIDDEGKASPFRHDGSPALRTHTFNARARANQWGTSLGKVNRDSDKVVDLAVAMVGAVLGARDALNSGKARTAPRRAPRRLY